MLRWFFLGCALSGVFCTPAGAANCHLVVSGLINSDYAEGEGSKFVLPGGVVSFTQIDCADNPDHGPLEGAHFDFIHYDRSGAVVESGELGRGVSKVNLTVSAETGHSYYVSFIRHDGLSFAFSTFTTNKRPESPNVFSSGACYFNPIDSKYYLSVNLGAEDNDPGYQPSSPLLGVTFTRIIDGDLSELVWMENYLWDSLGDSRYKGLAQILPGPHSYKFASYKGQLRSSEFTDEVNVNATRENCLDLPGLNFKATLDDGDESPVNNKQYLFDSCAPGSDPCKAKAADFTAGEFLSNDKIIVDSTATGAFGDGVATYIQRLADGDDPGDPNPMRIDPGFLFGATPAYQIERSGNYEITLKRNYFAGNFETRKKKFQAVDAITTFDPNKTYFQGNYPGQKMGYSRTKTIGGKGCALSNVGTIFQKSVPSVNFSPPSLDKLLIDAKLYAADADLTWEAAANVHNALSTGAQIKFEWGSEKTVAEFEDMGRKRSYTVIEVPGTQALRGDDPTTIAKCVHKSFIFNPPKRIVDSIPVCYRKLQHFILVNGMLKKPDPGGRITRVADPASLERTTLDHPFYKSSYRSNRKFLVKSDSPNPADKKSFIQMMLPPDVRFRSLRVNGRLIAKTKMKGNSGKIFDLPGAYAEILMSANNDLSESEEITGGLFLTIPEFEGGSYQIEFDNPYYYKGYAELKVVNEEGKVNSAKKIPITIDRGVFSNISFSANPFDEGILNGDIAISSFKKMSNVVNKPPIAIVRGSVSPPSGGEFNLLTDGLDVLLGEEFQHIKATSFSEEAGSFVFTESQNVTGVRRFVLRPNGEFELETSGWDIRSVYSGGKEKIELNSGRTYLTGYILASNLVTPDVVDARFDKEFYRTGDLARISVSSLKKEIPEGGEFYLEAFLNGQQVRVSRVRDGYWKISSPALSQGENWFTFLLYQQDRRLTESLVSAVSYKRSAIVALEEELRKETDFEKKQALEVEKSKLLSDIVDLENRIKLGRTRVGDPYGRQINVD